MDQFMAQVPVFEQIIAEPSLNAMLALSWQDFQKFIEYLFACAGYRVEDVSQLHFPNGPGVDLNIKAETGKVIGRVEVRRLILTTKIDVNDVSAFWGMLDVAGGKTGYLITTSDFTAPAKAFAATATTREKLWLIEGARLLRYISYVRSSRGKNAQGFRRIPHPTSPHWLFHADTWQAARAQQRTNHATICTVSNNKGGVAKTTTALNLGVVLAEMRQRSILLIDMDGQASLTFALPPPDPAPVPNLTDYFAGYRKLQELITPTEFPGIHIIRAHPDLHAMDTGGIAKPESELRFVKDVQSIPNYDWIIIDTPPARTQYTRHALAAADQVIIPVVVETLAANGVNSMLNTYESMRALVGKPPALLGAIITRWKQNALMQTEKPTLVDALRSKSVHVFATSIPHDDNVDKAIRGTSLGSKKSLFTFRKNMGAAAVGYQNFVEEILPNDLNQ